jgi:hypothetical protein
VTVFALRRRSVPGRDDVGGDVGFRDLLAVLAGW